MRKRAIAMRAKELINRFKTAIGGRLYRLVKRYLCEHTHTFSFYPDKEKTWWNYRGKSKGHHEYIVIEGCYKCGKVWCKDYGA